MEDFRGQGRCILSWRKCEYVVDCPLDILAGGIVKASDLVDNMDAYDAKMTRVSHPI
jgi:hypothetical protein